MVKHWSAWALGDKEETKAVCNRWARADELALGIPAFLELPAEEQCEDCRSEALECERAATARADMQNPSGVFSNVLVERGGVESAETNAAEREDD